jgi:hypothetical protein
MSSSIEICIWKQSQDATFLLQTFYALTDFFRNKNQEQYIIEKIVGKDSKNQEFEFHTVDKASSVISSFDKVRFIRALIYYPCYRSLRICKIYR